MQCNGVAPRVTAEQRHVTVVGAEQPEQHANRRRLARAVRPEETMHFTGLDDEVETVQRSRRAERLDETRNRDRGHDLSLASAARPSLHIGDSPMLHTAERGGSSPLPLTEWLRHVRPDLSGGRWARGRRGRRCSRRPSRIAAPQRLEQAEELFGVVAERVDRGTQRARRSRLDRFPLRTTERRSSRRPCIQPRASSRPTAASSSASFHARVRTYVRSGRPMYASVSSPISVASSAGARPCRDVGVAAVLAEHVAEVEEAGPAVGRVVPLAAKAREQRSPLGSERLDRTGEHVGGPRRVLVAGRCRARVRAGRRRRLDGPRRSSGRR